MGQPRITEPAARTRRSRAATFTKAELRRMFAVAREFGKYPVATRQGIVFADSASIPLPSPDQTPDQKVEDWFREHDGN